MTWFDATSVDPATAQSQFPVGRHPVVIKSSQSLPVKDKPNAGLLALSCEIIDGPSKGITGVYRLNLWSDNAQAADIASKQLSAICHVTGIYNLNDTVNRCSELFGKPFCVIVSQQTANPQYTQVDGVTDMQGNPPMKGQPAATQTQPAQPAPQPAQPGWPVNAQPQAQPASTPAQTVAPSWGGAQQPPGSAQGWTQPPAPAAPAQAAPPWSQQPAPAQPAWSR